MTGLSIKQGNKIADYENDVIMGVVVLLVCVMATVYAIVTTDRSDNIWIIYGSAVAFAAGRAGTHVLHRTRAE